MITPSIKIRYTPEENMTDCPPGAYREKVSEEVVCYRTANVSENSTNTEIMDACFAIGGDVLHSRRDMVYICSIFNNVKLKYANDYNFGASSEYKPPFESNMRTICEENHKQPAALCLVPLQQNVTNSSRGKCPTVRLFEEVYPDYFFPESDHGPVSFACPEDDCVGLAKWECGTDGSWIGDADMT